MKDTIWSSWDWACRFFTKYTYLTWHRRRARRAGWLSAVPVGGAACGWVVGLPVCLSSPPVSWSTSRPFRDGAGASLVCERNRPPGPIRVVISHVPRTAADSSTSTVLGGGGWLDAGELPLPSLFGPGIVTDMSACTLGWLLALVPWGGWLRGTDPYGGWFSGVQRRVAATGHSTSSGAGRKLGAGSVDGRACAAHCCCLVDYFLCRVFLQLNILFNSYISLFFINEFLFSVCSVP